MSTSGKGQQQVDYHWADIIWMIDCSYHSSDSDGSVGGAGVSVSSISMFLEFLNTVH